MLSTLRRYTPLLIGSGAVLLIIDIVILLYRALGLERGLAVYAALVTILGIGAVLLQKRWRKDSAPSISESIDESERNG